MDTNHSLMYSLRFNFLYVDIYKFTQTWIYPTTVLPYGLLRYIVSGEAIFSLNGHSFHVLPNQVVYLPEGATLDCKALTDDFTFMSIRFVTTVRVKDIDLLSDYFHVSEVTQSESDTVYGYFKEIYNAATSASPGKMFRIRGNLELIIAWLAERGLAHESSPTVDMVSQQPYTIEKLKSRALQTQHNHDPRMQAVEDYIVEHPKENLDLSLLCKIAQVSEPSLRRLFKQHTGKSPSHYIQELHMLTAARELLVTEKRISDIAYDLGYNNPNYFSRLFRHVFGISPNEYRRVSRA